MQELVIDAKINDLKPEMKVLTSLRHLTLKPETVIQAKVDGEFTLLYFSRDGSYTVNRYGHLRTDFHCQRH